MTTSPGDMAIPVPVHFDGHNINIITEVNFPNPPTPAKVSAAAANKDRQSLYKTELCREWSTSGWCYYGKRCSFAHGLNELRPVFRSKKWRTKRCRNWQGTGYCPYEHRCQFLHDQSPPRRMTDFEEEDGDDAAVETPTGSATHSNANSEAGVAGDTSMSKSKTLEQQQKELYFHFQVHPGDARGDESETATDDSENQAGAPTRRNVSRLVGNSDVLNEIGNTGRTKRHESSNDYGTAGAAESPYEDPERKKRRLRGKKQGEPIVTPFIPTNSSNQTRRRRRNPTNPLGQQQSQQPGTQNPIGPNPTISRLHAQQIVGNQTAATQLAAQFSSLHLNGSNSHAYFDPINRTTTPTLSASVMAQLPHQSIQQSSQLGGQPSNQSGQQPGHAQPQSGLAGAPGMSGLNLPSVPMGGENALLSALYAMGPGLQELYYAAQMGQLPQAELEQLIASTYPSGLTAPVPFAQAPMSMTPIPTGTPAPNNATLVLDRMLRTPSGSVEPPGFENAFYPTPSPPPSSFGVDSVSNMGLPFIPQDSPAPFLSYAGGHPQPGAGGMGLHNGTLDMNGNPMGALDPTQFLMSLQNAGLSVPQSTTPVPFGFGGQPVGSPTFDSGMYAGNSTPRYFAPMTSPPPNAAFPSAFGMSRQSSGDMMMAPDNIVLFQHGFGNPVVPVDGSAQQSS